jgi:glycosyltransferase involved in cell wall biosynthesis
MRILIHAFAMVLPSGQETAPIGVNMAMAAAVPVVATRVGGVPWLVADAVTGCLAGVGDVTKLAEALLCLLSDRELVQEENGYSSASGG